MKTKKNKPKGLDIEGFIDYWNIKYPIDRLYRKKYGIAFGSDEHKKLNFISMSVDLKEDLIIHRQEKLQAEQTDEDLFNDNLPGDVSSSQNQAPNRIKRMTKKEVDKEFDNLDLSKFNETV